MKKKKYTEGQTIEFFRPFAMIIQFAIAAVCMYVCMVYDDVRFGLISIFCGWQAGWGMQFGRYINGEVKKGDLYANKE